MRFLETRPPGPDFPLYSVMALRTSASSPRLALILSALFTASASFAADAAAVKAYTPKLAEVRSERSIKAALPSSRAGMARAKEYWLSPVTRDDVDQVKPKAGLTLAGIHRHGAAEMLTRGEWVALPGGRAGFRTALRSPGAKGVRIHFREFSVGEGKLWLHDGEPDGAVAGPYTANGPLGDGDFWSDVVFGESVVIEYEPETGTSQSLPFLIEEISHILSDIAPGKLLTTPETGPAAMTEVRGPVETLPGSDLLRAAAGSPPRADALTCNLDLTCYPQWAERAKSVARYLFETSGGTALCSGSLVNTRNSSGKLYFLTADHCISTEAEARSVQTFWFYQTSACNGPAPSTRNAQTGLGATFLASGGLAAGDYSLLELRNVPPGVTFSGWTSTEHTIGSAVTGVHHPRGDYKRISFGSRRESIQNRSRPDDKFYTVIWDRGVTEGGSSGSPIFNDQGLIVGMLSGGPRPPDGQTECDLRPAFDWYGKLSVAYPALQNYLEDRQVGTPPPQTGPVGTALISNTPRQFSLGPVTSPTLFSGDNVLRIDVPQGATRLEVQVRTRTLGADIDLFVRRGAAPATTGQSVQADYNSTSDTGEELVIITPTSTPALQAGTYYIALALFSPGVVAEGSVTAIVTTANTTPPPAGNGPTLTSGQARNWSFGPVDSATLFGGENAFQVNVPQGATRLEIRVVTSTRGVDTDLFVRFGQVPAVVSGSVQSDFSSETEAGEETIVITPSSSPALRAGTYFIALAVFTRGVRAEGSLVATVTTPGSGSGGSATPLLSGVAQPFTLQPVTGATLISSPSFRITVPQGATRLRLQLRSSQGVDVDLHARFDRAPDVSDGRIVADHSSAGDTGDENLSIDAAGNPPLRPGTYFISLAVFTANRTITGTLTAFVDTASATPPQTITLLTSGVPGRFAFPAERQPTLYRGNYGFQVIVPEGATTLTVRLNTLTPNADLDLYVRRGADVDLADGEVVADGYAEGPTGNETIVLTRTSNPPLQPGTWYFAVGVFTRDVEVTGTVTATIERATSAPQPSGGNSISLGQPVRWSLNSVSSPTLFTGMRAYRLDVENISRFEVRLTTDTPGADVDLYVRYGTPPEIQNGRVVADFSSASLTGNELVTISPGQNSSMRSGTYWVALAVFTNDVATQGSLLATATAGSAPQGEETSGLKRRILAGRASADAILQKQPAVLKGEVFGSEILLKDKLKLEVTE